MSSLDSPIHSTSTAFLVDFVRRFARHPPGQRAELFWARLATVAFGLAATLCAFYAAESDEGILQTLVTWLGYFAGPLLGLFLLGMLSRRANEKGALVGVGCAFVGLAAPVLLPVLFELHLSLITLAALASLVLILDARTCSDAGWKRTALPVTAVVLSVVLAGFLGNEVREELR